MANQISLKKSSVSGKVPTANNLVVGELAINLSDQILHSKDANNEVFLIKAEPLYNTGLQDKLDAKVDVAGDTMTGNLEVEGTITTDVLQFNTAYSDGTADQGEVFWNPVQRTYNLGLGNGVVGQAFQELYYPLVKNNTANTIPNGTAVSAAGSDNGNLTVIPYISDGSMPQDSYLGLTTEDIPSGSFGFVTYFGRVHDLNTSAWAVGTPLYASDSVYGSYSDIPPVSPSDIIIIGVVSHQGTTNGSIDVRLDLKPRSDQIPYDNTASELVATNVKGALDELQANKANIGDISSTIMLYFTTANTAISDYKHLVDSVEDTDYNSTATPFNVGTITTLEQYLGGFITDPGLIEGNPGIINLTTIGRIVKTAGNDNQYSEFYFDVHKRTAEGVETDLSTSGTTGPVNKGVGQYDTYSTTALLNDGIFLPTDRLVIKVYGNALGSSGGGTYSFQFGGDEPLRTLLPVPINVIPAQKAEDTLTNTTNFNKILSSAETNVQAALDKLDDYAAPLMSPTFTGEPTAPTAASNSNNTQIATTAFVQTVIGSVTVDNADKLDGYHANSFPLLSGLLGGQTLIGGSGVTDKLVLQGTTGNGTSTSAALQVNVGNNGATNAVTVLNNGNVGIGTTTPGVMLDVTKNSYPDPIFRVTNTRIAAGSSNPSFDLSSPNIATGGNVYFSIGKAASTNNRANLAYIHVADGSALNYMNVGSFYGGGTGISIQSSGNVSIGTTSPTAKLQIQGSGTTTGVTLQTQDSTGTAKFKVLDSGITSITSNDSSALTDLTINPTLKTSGNLLDLQLNGTSKFKVDYTGTITTDSPTLVTNLNADLLDGQHSSYYTTAENLTGTIPSTVLGNSTVYIGTTSIALNRSSTSQTLTGISIDGTANTATYFGGQISSYYAPVNSPVFTGSVTTTGPVAVKDSVLDTSSTDITTTTQTTVYSFSATYYRTAKFLVQINDTTNSQYHSIELLLIHDGTTVSLVQYGSVYTVSELGTFDATITSGVVNLYFTATAATTKRVAVSVTLMTINAGILGGDGVSWERQGTDVFLGYILG